MSTSVRRSVENFFAAKLAEYSYSPLPFLTSSSDEVDPDPPYFVVIAEPGNEVFEQTHHYAVELRIAIVTPVDTSLATATAEHEERCHLIKTAIEEIPQYVEDLYERFVLLGYKIDGITSADGESMDALVSSWTLRVGCAVLTPEP